MLLSYIKFDILLSVFSSTGNVLNIFVEQIAYQSEHFVQEGHILVDFTYHGCGSTNIFRKPFTLSKLQQLNLRSCRFSFLKI